MIYNVLIRIHYCINKRDPLFKTSLKTWHKNGAQFDIKQYNEDIY